MNEKETPIRSGKDQTRGSRPNMEDFLGVDYLEEAQLTVAVVADGIGGGPHGELAAQLTVETILKEVRDGDKSNIPNLLNHAVQQANQRVFPESRKPANRGMGSTTTVVAIQNNKLYLANLGDSRAYLVREQAVIQLSRDHTWGNYLKYEEGKIVNPNDPRTGELVRSIGHAQQVKVDLGIYLTGNERETEAVGNQGYELQAGDRVVVCTDGLIKSRHNDTSRQYVELEEMRRIVQRYEPQKAAEKLVQQAEARQVDDNASVIVLEVPGGSYTRRPYFPQEYITRAVGVTIALVFIVMLLFFRSDSPATITPTALLVTTPTTQPATFTSTITNTPVTPVPTGVMEVVRFDSSARYTILGENAKAVTGENISLLPGLILESRGGVLEIKLEAIRLVLDANSVIVIEQVSGVDGAEETIVRMQGGKLVAEGKTTVLGKNRQEARSLSVDGILGVLDEAGKDNPFTLHCLQGGCQLNGVFIDMGLANCVGASCGSPFLAQYDLFDYLSPRIPTPTATPTLTPSPTSTSTNTFVPTKTVPPVTTTPSLVSPTSIITSTAFDDNSTDEPPASTPVPLTSTPEIFTQTPPSGRVTPTP